MITSCRYTPQRRAKIALALLLGSTAGALTSSADVLIASDFNANVGGDNRTFRDSSAGATNWFFYTYGFGALSIGNNTGTVDRTPTGRAYSKAVRLSADFSTATGNWNTAAFTGQLQNPNTSFTRGGTDQLLNLSFDLRASRLHPVKVYARSYDNANQLTGTSVATVIPPVVGAFFRHSLDLSAMTAEGTLGAFNPASPKVEFGFLLAGNDTTGWPKAPNEILIDNLSYTSPSFYVSGTGNDGGGRNGRSLGSAFRTIQKAIDSAQPGDVIMVLNGLYASGEGSNFLGNFSGKIGSPARWIVLRNYPGQQPDLNVQGSNGLGLNGGSAAYIEVRGMNIRGRALNTNLAAALDDAKYITIQGTTKGVAQVVVDGKLTNGYGGSYLYNGNGISFDGRNGAADARVNHIRIIDNRVYDHCGSGISLIGADYVTVQNNVVFGTSRFTRYATSGLSLQVQWNFDATSGYKAFLLQNKIFDNYCQVFWTRASYDLVNGGSGVVADSRRKKSDGNGLIVDFNKAGPTSSQASVVGDGTPYRGRTLVQNNVSYHNGGAGLQAFNTQFVDFFNNSTYKNNRVENYGELFINAATDVKAYNNILWGTNNKQLSQITSSSSVVDLSNNVYYTDLGPATSPAPNTVNDAAVNRLWPRYVTPGLTEAADFRLAAGAPGIDSGRREIGAPINDIEDRRRPDRATGATTSNLDRGAHEYVP